MEKARPNFGEALTRAASRIEEAIRLTREDTSKDGSDERRGAVGGLVIAQDIIKDEYERARRTA